MQRFTCPFCGLRDETEFHYVAEAGKVRPDTTKTVSNADWAHYLYAQGNNRGPAREVWMHLTCAELFVMERDTATAGVRGVTPLRRAGG